ncbi:MAG: ABC transporter substrate-binding protein [Candidatus Eisenbacteria bacterium]|nr:ABC transporter substrate-binding protein [Candidatus Eisenbacteria bacterium]MCC7144712.1 ABC transporter substrate-binding protein [Candidatus Eisenbacteria bacterium]
MGRMPIGRLQAVWRLARVIALTTLASIVCACGSSTERAEVATPPSPRAGGTLRVLHEPIGSLDPVFIDDVYEGNAAQQIFEGLIALDPNLSPKPALAESWTLSDDGKLYVFRLRSDVRFHDGTPLDAAVAKRSLTLVLRPDKPSACLPETYFLDIEGAEAYAAGDAREVSGIRVRDPRTLEIQLVKPLSFFLAVLAMGQAALTPARLGETWAERQAVPIGTGPFRFVRWEQDGSVLLARNDDYWSVPALLDSLHFISGAPMTPQRTTAALFRHQADGASLASSQARLVEEVGGFRVMSTPELSLTFLGINTKNPPLDRREVRQALARCVSPAAILESKENRVVMAQGILPPGMPGYRPEDRRPPYDPVEARRLLSLAGFPQAAPDRPLRLVTTRMGNRSGWLREQYIKDLERIGLEIELEELDWAELDRVVLNGETDLFNMTWVADVPDPDAFLYFLFRTGEVNNLVSFSDPMVDSLLAEGRRCPPGPKRFEIYSEIEARVLAAMPLVPLYHETAAYAWDPRIEGIEATPFGLAQTTFKRAWFRPERPMRTYLADLR